MNFGIQVLGTTRRRVSGFPASAFIASVEVIENTLSSAIDTSGATLIVWPAKYNGAGAITHFYDDLGISLALTAVANAVGVSTVYTMTSYGPAAADGLVGYAVFITGFSNGANNSPSFAYDITASTTTSITVHSGSGIAESASANGQLGNAWTRLNDPSYDDISNGRLDFYWTNKPHTSATHKFFQQSFQGTADVMAFSGGGAAGWSVDTQAGTPAPDGALTGNFTTDTLLLSSVHQIVVATEESNAFSSQPTVISVNNGFTLGPVSPNSSNQLGGSAYLADTSGSQGVTFTNTGGPSGWTWGIVGFKPVNVTPDLPELIANIAQQQISNFGSASTTTGSIDTTGANFLVVVASTYDGGTGSPTNPALIADLVGGTVADSPLSVTSVTQSGSDMILNGTFPGGGSNAYAGSNFFVGGFTSSDSVDNGGYTCTASSTTTITLTNPSGVTTASAGQAIITTNIWHYLERQTDYGNSCMYYCYNAIVGAGHTFLLDTITLGGDGGGLAVQAWSGIRSSSDPLVPSSYNFTRGVGAATTDSTATIQGSALSGTDLTITGGWLSGGTNEYVGMRITLAGYTGGSVGNNGVWYCTASTGGSITVTIPSGGFNGQAGTPVWSIPLPDANTLVIAGLGGRNAYGSRSIDSGFTITDAYTGGTLFASASMAYLISPNVLGVSPFWTIGTSSINMDMVQAAFYHA